MTIKQVSICFAVAFFLQLSFINTIAIAGIAPNLVLCLATVIIFKFEYGFRCIPFALVAMLLVDLFTGAFVGVSTLALFAVMVFVTWWRIYFNTDLYKTMAFMGAIATLMFNIVLWILMTILQTHYHFWFMFKNQGFYILYNVAVMLILFFFMSEPFRRWWRLRRGLEEEEQ